MIGLDVECCCTHYDSSDYSVGYVMLPIFKVKICENCGDVTMICNSILQRVFALLFLPFWHGKVYVFE